MKKQIEGKCKLCLEQGLLQNSHIYPKFMIKHMRDQNHDNKFEFLSDKEVKIPPQDGPKEYLLCHNCEKKLCTYEKYYKEFFLDKKGIIFNRMNEQELNINNYNYKYIRLFLLSILWRLSITNIDGFKIDLEVDDQEFLRLLIDSENPGTQEDFPFYTILVSLDGKNDSHILMNPIEINEPLKNTVMIYICGILYWFSKSRINNEFNLENSLSEDQWVVNFRPLKSFKFLIDKILNTL